MPMPSSTTLIRLGTDGSSLMPVSIAVPTTAPLAMPPMTETSSSGTSAARTLRKTSTWISTISPSMTLEAMVDRVFVESSESIWSARPPVKPVRM